MLYCVALAVTLGGCSSWGNPLAGAYYQPLFGSPERTVPAPEPNVMPANYRAKLLNFLENELYDPNDIRDAYITEPKLMPFGTENRYAVCVRYNAKTGYGQYTGVRDYIGIYFHGDLTQFVPASPDQCANAAYVRWPELEKLRKRQF
jgi:hypothetical protein